ncbi:MAG: hypothetical protein ACKO1F_15255 [Flammeovirgaceae bacterium]
MAESACNPMGKELLLQALQAYGLSVIREDGNKVYTESDYCIEVEGPHLFKLSQDGYIVAPYDNLDEVCQMIKMG